METEASFHALLRRIYDRHAPTLVTMARGVHELRKKMVEEGRCTSAEFANLTESSREGGLNARVGPRRATARAASAREPPLRARSQSTTFSTPSTWRVLAFGFSLGSTWSCTDCRTPRATSG